MTPSHQLPLPPRCVRDLRILVTCLRHRGPRRPVRLRFEFRRRNEPDGGRIDRINPPEQGPRYATTVFEMPFDLDVPDWLSPNPSEEQPHFVTWHDPSNDRRAVRFLIPVEVYEPGTSGASRVPADYMSYLTAQAAHGASFEDDVTTTVDGRAARVVTARVDAALDGSLGCPDAEMAASDCFGLQPEFVLRIAVIDTDGAAPLLVWLRDDVGAASDFAADRDAFDRLLANITFSDRDVEAPPISGASALDGTYQWTITEDDALAHGTPDDRTPENLATLPWTFRIEISEGAWTLVNTDSSGSHEEGRGTFTVADGTISFNWQGNTLAFDVAVDEHGSLRLTPRPPMDPGDQYVWSTKPWDRVDAVTETSSTAPSDGADAPVGIIAIGHSGLTGENSDPARPGQDARENSWATGTAADVDSVYERLIAIRPETEGHVANTSRGGAVAESLALQAKAGLAIVPHPALVIIQSVDNDIRCDGTDGDHVEQFGLAVADALEVITTASPDTRILIVGQTGRPDPGYVEALVAAHPDVRRDLTGSGICDFYDSAGNLVPAHFDALSSIIDAYEAEQARVCSAVPQCATLDRSGYPEILDDYSNDFNHLNTHGLARAAEIAWPSVESLLGLDGQGPSAET